MAAHSDFDFIGNFDESVDNKSKEYDYQPSDLYYKECIQKIFLKRQKVYCFLTFKKLTFLPKYGIMSTNYEGVVPHSSVHMCELNQQHAARLV